MISIHFQKCYAHVIFRSCPFTCLVCAISDADNGAVGDNDMSVEKYLSCTTTVKTLGATCHFGIRGISNDSRVWLKTGSIGQ